MRSLAYMFRKQTLYERPFVAMDVIRAFAGIACVPDVGKVIAPAIVVTAPDPAAFKSARDSAAPFGLAPRRNSSGGKQKLGAIAIQGNRCIRTLLVLGATCLLSVVSKRKGRRLLRGRKRP